MLTVARRRPSASLAWARWTSRWVSTPTVTRGRCRCAMVVMPSPFCDQAVDGTRRRAGGQHCNGSGATGSYQVTVARWRCPWRPQRASTGLATSHQASGTTGQTLATTTTARSLQWNNSNNETVLEAARAEIRKATDGNPPPVLDPFCGGGSIPLEAQRLGLEAHASDLNPVAVLITKALVEIPPKFAGHPPVNPESREKLAYGATWKGAQGLAEDVRYYGRWMRDEAFKRIGHLYPTV